MCFNTSTRVRQGSILGSVLFKIKLKTDKSSYSVRILENRTRNNSVFGYFSRSERFMKYMLLVLDTTHFVKEHYQKWIYQLCSWHMKLNTDKCYILIHMQEQNVLKTGYFNLKNPYYEKLLCINFDCKLKFHLQIGDICKKEPRKLNG